MAITMLAWLVAIPVLGATTGLRTLTPITALCWFACAGQLPLGGTWASWMATLPAAIVFTVLALGEYVGDKLPRTPNRTAPFPLMARLVFGGVVGAAAATGLNGSAFEGILLGALGALAGAFLGFHIRHDLVRRNNWPDWRVAILEDAITIGCAVLAMGIVTG